MKKIAIITDSSSSISSDSSLKHIVEVVPLNIIHGGKEYLDQVNITSADVNNLLRDKQLLQTSQPSVGGVIEVLEKLKAQAFDHIYAITISGNLSGTLNSFNQAIQQLDMDNVTLIDSFSVAGPAQHIAAMIYQFNQDGKSHEHIMAEVDNIVDNTISFLYPETLDQLKRSGRISKAAATLASLLKIKPILYLEHRAKTIEKFGTARTETKVYDLIIEQLKSQNITADRYNLYYLENEAKDKVNALNDRINEEVGVFKFEVLSLPAVLATHVGLGTMAVQWVPKF